MWGAACQNAAYLAAICYLELRFRATTGGRLAIWEIAQQCANWVYCKDKWIYKRCFVKIGGAPEKIKKPPENPQKWTFLSLAFYNAHSFAIGPPDTGSPGPFGPGTREESEKSPERVPGAGPQSAQRVRFETPVRTLWALLGPWPGCSFRTLFGLFWGSGPEGPGRPCVGRGRSQCA